MRSCEKLRFEQMIELVFDTLFIDNYSRWYVTMIYIAGSSNGRTPGFGPGYLGSSPSPAAVRIKSPKRGFLHYGCLEESVGRFRLGLENLA